MDTVPTTENHVCRDTVHRIRRRKMTLNPSFHLLY
jgi:hypothetical protein